MMRRSQGEATAQDPAIERRAAIAGAQPSDGSPATKKFSQIAKPACKTIWRAVQRA